MGRFSQMLEQILGHRQEKNRTKGPQWYSAHLEPLEDRALLSAAPIDTGQAAAFAEILNTADDALVELPVSGDSNAQTTQAQYLDTDGSIKTVTATVVDGSMKNNWNAGWYVVNSNVSITDADVCCKGDVKLILADGCSLTVEGASRYNDKNAGITVNGYGNSLTIYGQTNGTGILKATGGKYCAGIGGDNNKAGEHITINGGTVIAQGGRCAAGIGGGMYGTGQDITINGGNITATGGYKGAGIGGGENRSGYSITINSGTITAKGGDYASGIGGGDEGRGESITINGGNITTTGGDYGAGIGGGEKGVGQNITIKQGTVNATGGKFAAGIGGGNQRIGQNITIDNGTVTAQGGKGAAGIGGGGSDNIFVTGKDGRYITINGGTVTATGGEKGGAGIGGGNCVYEMIPLHNGDGEFIKINGGTVIATGSFDAAGIGGGARGKGHNIEITDGTVTAIGGSCGAGIGGGVKSSGENITIIGGTVTATGGKGAAGIGGGMKSSGVNITIAGGNVTAMTNEGPSIGDEIGSCIGGGYQGYGRNIKINVYSTITAGDNAATVKVIDNSGGDLAQVLSDKKYVNVASKAQKEESVTYVDEKGQTQTVTATVVDKSMGFIWHGGWYVVNSNVTINNAAITCKGDVKLILADGCSLTVTGADNKAGIGVSGTGNSLTIYGQLGKTGKLTATGGNYGAGIGGGEHGNGNNITINGGIIEATGGNYGAGIGGGEGHSSQSAGRDITINGGKVIAQGGIFAAGIGGGGDSGTFMVSQGGHGINIKINGGEVEARGGAFGAGIGGGSGKFTGFMTLFGGYGLGITITGGTVNAYGGVNASGIGGGFRGISQNIKVDVNSTVKAGNDAASAKVIDNSGGDLARALDHQTYVSIIPKVQEVTSAADAAFVTGTPSLADKMADLLGGNLRGISSKNSYQTLDSLLSRWLRF